MKKKLIWLAVMLLLFPFAGAAQEQPVQITITGSILESARLSDAGLETANSMLNRLTIRETLWQGGDLAELMIDGELMWWVQRQETEENTQVNFSGVNLYTTKAGQPDAFMLLAGGEESGEAPYFSPAAVREAAGPVFSVIEKSAAPSKKQSETPVQMAASSPSYDLFKLSADDMNALWSEVLQSAWLCFYSDGGETELLFSLQQVCFTGDVSLKRLYTRQGEDMGFQLTGTGMVEGSERKITLLAGYTPGKGGSFTLTARALKGKEQIKLTATLKETLRDEKETYQYRWETNVSTGGETEKKTFSANLIKTPGESGHNLSGALEWAAGNETVLVDAEVSLQESGGRFTLEITQKEKKKSMLKARLEGNYAVGAEVPAAGWEQQISLEDCSDTEALQKLYPENMVLMRALMYLMDDVPANDRWLLTHELRDETWHTGPVVPVYDAEDQWMVEEEE